MRICNILQQRLIGCYKALHITVIPHGNVYICYAVGFSVVMPCPVVLSFCCYSERLTRQMIASIKNTRNVFSQK